KSLPGETLTAVPLLLTGQAKYCIKIVQIRVRSKINLHFQGLRHPHGKARGGRIVGYLTDEQRSHAGLSEP
ncbi:MAG: hypothetical protein LWX55_13050, partial [Deltaproteobacteria bacterium]|nr:hypothetical protein [Deltaproteobacteria bacterium]